MAEFTIKIAGKTALVRSLFDSTRDYCRRYLTEEKPDFFIENSREDLAFEQEAARIEAIEEGFRFRRFSDPFLDRAAVQRKLAEHLFDWDTLLFHGSAVAVDGQGYLFTAKSGTGKSTHTRLWREVFGARAVMVNDDKPFLKLAQEGVALCGAPWSGKHGLDANITVPLKGICILERGTENRIARLTPEEALPRLRHETYRPLDESRILIWEAQVDRLAQSVPLWRMECTKEAVAARIAYSAMSFP